ncbi:MAG: hypothetical protein R3F11_08745 [Verrucomicrobiales bacterium]
MRSGAKQLSGASTPTDATSATLPGGETLGISYDREPQSICAGRSGMGHTTSFAYDQRNNLPASPMRAGARLLFP